MIKFLINLVLGMAVVTAGGQEPSIELVHTQVGAEQVVEGFYIEDGDTLTLYTDGSYTITSTKE